MNSKLTLPSTPCYHFDSWVAMKKRPLFFVFAILLSLLHSTVAFAQTETINFTYANSGEGFNNPVEFTGADGLTVTIERDDQGVFITTDPTGSGTVYTYTFNGLYGDNNEFSSDSQTEFLEFRFSQPIKFTKIDAITSRRNRVEMYLEGTLVYETNFLYVAGGSGEFTPETLSAISGTSSFDKVDRIKLIPIEDGTNDIIVEPRTYRLYSIEYETLNESPSITFDAVATGGAVVGQPITPVYTYSDPEGDEESGTTFQWYIDGVAIDGATKSSYTPTIDQLGGLLKVEITPSDSYSFGQQINPVIGTVSCADGFTCETQDVSVCDAYTYQVPDGPLVSENGSYESTSGTVKTYYNVTFDRTETTSNIFSDAVMANAPSITYTANTNITGVLSFDNSQDYWVDMNALQDDLNGTSRSIFMWIKTGNVSSDAQQLFGINPAGNGNTITNLFIDNNGNNLETNDGGSNRSASFDVSGEVWNYVGYTYDAATNETVIYANGLAQTTYTNNQLTTATSRYSLGQEFDGATKESNHYNGEMAEISVWNEVLTGAEIREAMSAKITSSHPKYANLVGYYSVFGACDDDTAVLKDYSGNSNDGVMKNGFTQDFKNVEAIEGFNSIGWYENISWQKDGAEVATGAEYTFDASAGSYALVATRNFVQSTDSWSITAHENEITAVDSLSDETLCTDDAITRMTTDVKSVNYLNFEKDSTHYIDVSSIADDLVGTDRSIFMWVNKESAVPSGDSYQLLTIAGDNGIDVHTRFYISAGEKLGIVTGGNDYESGSILTGEWTHVGYAHDATTEETKMYINGEVIRTITGKAMPVEAGSIASLGMRYDEDGPSRFMDGQMAEITVWDKALSEEEVAGLMAAAPAYDAGNLIAAYGMLPSFSDNRLFDLTANGNDGLATSSSIFVTDKEAVITGYDASAQYSFSWKKEGAEFDTDATANITIDEGTTTYGVTYGTPFFQKTDEFSLSYTNLLPTQPVTQTAGVSGSVTFEVDEIAGASYQWYSHETSSGEVEGGQNGYPASPGLAREIHFDDGKLYIATNNGIATSTDNGMTWVTLNSETTGFPSNEIMSIFFEGNNWYVGTSNNGISISNDGGNTWNTIGANQNGFPLSNLPTDIEKVGNIIYVSTEQGIAVSSDEGSSWTTISAGQNGFSASGDVEDLYVINDKIYAATEDRMGALGGVSISLDGGATWTTTDVGENGFPTSSDVWSVYAEGDNVYAGTNDGLAISRDGGQTWAITTSGQNGFSSSNSIRAIAGEGSTIYAGTTAGLSVSNDRGQTWTQLGVNNVLLSVYAQDGLMVAGDNTGELFIQRSQRELSNESNTTATNYVLGATTHRLTVGNLVLDPDGTEYFVEVSKDGCTQTSDDVSLTVLDVPVLISMTPASGTTDVAIDTEIILTFSRDIALDTRNSVKLVDSSGNEITNISAARTTLTDVTLTINQELAYATTYSLLMEEGFAVDVTDGSKLALAVTDLDAFSFTTVCETLVVTQPTDQTGYVSGSATFSVPEVSGASYQWYQSTGDTWITTTANQNGFANLSFVSDLHVEEERIFVGTFGGGVSISTDGGESWTTTLNDENGFSSSPSVSSVYADGDKLYAATTLGLSISTDGGASWTTTTGGENGFSASGKVSSVYAEGNNVYAGTTTSIGYGSFSKSTDGGLTWTTTTSGQNGFASSEDIQSVFADGNKVYVGTSAGLSISNDGGANWTTTTSGENGFAHNYVSEVFAEGDMVYAATGAGLCISTDGGANWSTITSGQNGFANSNTINSVFAEGNNIYVGTATAGMSISNDSGATWATTTSGESGFASDYVASVVPLGNQVFAATNAGLSVLAGNEAMVTSTDNSADNAIKGADTRELTISNLTADLDQTEYVVVVTKGDCEETSNTVTLSIAEVPVLTDVSPASGATDVAVDTDIVLTFSKIIRAFGGADKKFYLEDEDGLKTSSYTGSKSDQVVTLSLNQPLKPGTKYSILMDEGFVLGTVGSETDISPAVTDNTLYTFTTTCDGLITSELTAQTADVGGSVTLEIPPVEGATYQWRRLIFGVFQNITNVTDKISGATTNSLTISNLETSDNDYSRYSLTVTTDNCTIKTNEVDITVNDAPSSFNFTSTTPADNALDIAVDASLSITFENNVQAGSGLIQVFRADNDQQFGEVSVLTGVLVTIIDNTVNIRLGDAGHFDSGTEYYVTMPAGAFVSTDDNNVGSEAIVKGDWSFTTVAAPVELVSLTPESGATEVALDASFTMTFSEEVQGAIGLEAKLYNAADDSEVIDYSQTANQNLFTFSGNQVTVSFGEYLEASTTYYVQMTNVAVWSKNNSTEFAGISDKTTFRFTTKDVPPVEVVSFSPENGATGIATDFNEGGNNFTINFKEPVSTAFAANGGSIEIYDASNDELLGANTIPNTGSFFTSLSNEDKSFSFALVKKDGSGLVELIDGQEYYILISKDHINRASDGAPYTITDSNVWRFGVGTASNTFSHTSFSPSNGATDVETDLLLNPTFNSVSVDNPMRIHFEEPISAGTSGVVGIYKVSDDSPVVEYDMATETIGSGQIFSGSPSSGFDMQNITIVNVTEMVSPMETNTYGALYISSTNVTLENDTEYYVLIDEGAVVNKDDTSLEYEGISDKTTWTFTTESASGLTLESLTPATGATDVALDASFVMTFSEDVSFNNFGFEFKLYSEADDSEVLDFSGQNFNLLTFTDNTISVTFGDNLVGNTTYYIQIGEGAIISSESDAVFAGINDKTTFRFTTEQTVEPIVATEFAPANNSANVPLNIKDHQVGFFNGHTIGFGKEIKPGSGGLIQLIKASDQSVVIEINTATDPIVIQENIEDPVGKAYIEGFVNQNIIINDDLELEANTQYYWNMEAGVVLDATTDAPSAAIDDALTWAFTTVTPPLGITDINPDNNDTDVDIDQYLRIQFDQNIVLGTGNVTIYDKNDQVFEVIDVTVDGNSRVHENAQLRVYPTKFYTPEETYYVLADASVAMGANGATFAGITDKTTWTFTIEEYEEIDKDELFPEPGSITYDVSDPEPFEIELDEDLELSDDSEVYNGNLRVYKSSNDALVATIELSDMTYDDDEITFTVSGLEAGTGYYVLFDYGLFVDVERPQIFEGITDPSVWSFTTLELPDAPSFVSAIPSANTTDVEISSNIKLTYSENIQANAGNVVLYDSEGNLVESYPTNSLLYSGTNVVIYPDEDLEYNTTYYVLVDNEAFVSNNGVTTAAITDVNTIRFTTEAQPNTLPVATSVDFTGDLEVNQELTGSYTYTDDDSDPESGSTFQWYVADDAAGNNSEVISGATSTNYTLTNNEEGKYVAFAVVPNDGTDAGQEVFSAYNGPVASAAVPTVVSTVPVDGALDVAKDADLSFTFSESVTKGTGNITLSSQLPGDITTIDVTSTEVTVSGTEVTINPASDLIAGQFYTVKFDASAFVDADGNNSAGLTSNTAWNFTVKAANAAPAALGVSINKSLVVDGVLEGSYTYFDFNMDSESGTTFKWYRSDDENGTNKAEIAGANAKSYTVVNADDGKFISFEVTPNDGIDVGTASESALFGPILINDGVTNIPPAFTSDALTTIFDNETYSYTVTYEDLNSDVPTLTKTTGPDWLTVSGFILSGDPTSANVGDHDVVLTLDDQNGGTVTQEFTVTVKASNTAPYLLQSVGLAGPLIIDRDLIGSYNFIDDERDADNSTFKWYRADDASGTNQTEINGATGTTYTLTADDAGKYISLEVTPNDGKVNGTPAQSIYRGPISKKEPTFAFSNVTKTYGDPAFDLSITTNSAGAVSYTLENDQTGAGLSGNTLTLGNAGTIKVVIDLAEDAEYKSRRFAGLVSVNKRNIEVLATNSSKTYGEADPTLEYSVTSGEIVSGDEVVTVSRDAGEGVGTYAINLVDGAQAGNYQITKNTGTFTINKKSITVTADAKTKVYGDTDPEFTYTITSRALETGDELSGALTRATGSNVGTYAIGNSLFNGNYEITFVTADLTITKKALTATADNQERNEGEENPELTITYDGFVLGDDATVLDTAPSIATTATSASAPGTYDITLTGGSDNNYNLNLINGTLTVNEVNNAPIVANPIADQSYDEGFGTASISPAGVFNDPDGDGISISASSGNTDVVTVMMSTTDGSIIITEVGVGTATITVTADDQKGGTVSDEFVVTVNAVNNDPVIANPIADQSYDEGFGTASISPAGVFNDPDGDGISISASSGNTDVVTVMMSTTDGSIIITEVGVGTATITVTADDQKGGTVSDEFVVTVNAVNNDPIVANPIANQSYDEGFGTASISPAGVFNDPDGDGISISASSGNTDVVTVMMSTTDGSIVITEVGVGTATITVTADDEKGGTVSDEFVVTVNAVNNDPIVANPIADQNYDGGFGTASISPAGVFNDPDGDGISISASSGNTDVVTVMMSTTDGSIIITEVGVGTATITVTADDQKGGTVSDEFVVTVNAVNNDPIVANPIADQSENEGFTSNTVDLTNVFLDEDGDDLTFSATSSDESVATVSVSGSTLTYTEVGNGNTTITVTADDSNGGTESDEFVLTINNVNDAPVAANAIADQTENEGFTSNTVDLTDVFTDADGDMLSFTASSSDEGVATVSVSGSTLTYTEVANGNTTITVTADDSNGGTESDEFVLTINNVNDAPVVANAIADQTENEDFTSNTVDLTNVFSDEDGDNLTFSAASSDESVATVSVSGSTLTYTEVANGNTTITVTADDGNGGTETDEFVLTINNVNDAPVVANAIADQTENEGFTSNTVDLTNVFTDADGDMLSFTASSSDEGVATVSLNGSTLTYTEVGNGNTTITVTADDSNGGTESDEFVLTINNVNDAPVVANAIADQTENEGFTSNTVDLTNVFSDADGDVLSYTATSSDESVATVSVSGSTLTYTEVGNGNTTITVTADDSNGGTESDEFVLTINNVNDAPVVANAIADQTENEGFTSNTVDLTNVFTDADGDDLTFSAISSDESVATVSVSGSTLTYTEVANGNTTITVTADDGNSGIVTDEFVLTINNVNDAPVVANAIADQTENEGFTSNTVDLTNVFSDKDGDDLTFSATSSDENVATVSVSGSTLTYTEVANGNTTITVTADDSNGGTESDEFELTIVDVNEAPVVDNPLADVEQEEGFESLIIDLSDVFEDGDGDALTYAVSVDDESVVTAFAGSFDLTITEVSPGQTTVTITAEDGRGGSVSDEFNITIIMAEVPAEPSIPQGFSPNGDGVNDQWVVPNIENYPNNRVNIFDRGGKLVYSTRGYNNTDNAFEGLTNGSSAISRSSGLPDGVYYYVIDLGNGETRKGTIIIKQ